ncbi:MAG: hypothetical protein DRJ66_05340 [Thermoprotei archaeon]|nr:MAG: hypothetical protein DRJ66_05340 [Thermoprotei archaeon]
MPLGGIGTGTISICGDGSLRQWEVLNIPCHTAYVPYSFFAIWIKGVGAKLLQSKPFMDEFNPGVLTNDHYVPEELRRLVERLPTVDKTKFIGEYPIATVIYEDKEIPVKITLRAFSPLIPLNSRDSALPVIFFIFTVRNETQEHYEVSIMASLQNFVGWDGISEIRGVRFRLYGGNYNVLRKRKDLTAIVMRNSLIESKSPRWGEIALALVGEGEHTWFLQWNNLDELWNEFSREGKLPNDKVSKESQPGTTWCSSIACRFTIKPNEERRITFIYAWFFPNRYVNWEQEYSPIKDDKSLFWIGNMYAKWFKGVEDILNYVYENLDRLINETMLFHDTFYDSTLPYALLDRVTANISIIRSPTCFWAEDGRFYGFEGCHGVSTGGKYGGCCPLNCTHVWNYEQTLSRLFPDLERTMREVELFYQQHPNGYIPHRVVLPLYLPRPWDRPIGGPKKPAIDGMLGTILKTYREYLWGAGRKWLKRLWPRLKLLMNYILKNYMVDENGVMWGEQPNTFDISVYGANTFIGSLYLASLLAMAKMAREVGDEEYANRIIELFKKASKAYDRLCWNGEYYIQVCKNRSLRYQWYEGCLTEQLVGQWWAHILGLGYVLPRNHVRRALMSIMKYNWRENFRNFPYEKRRIFAHEEHPGLLNCTWPKGGRPKDPILYCDEVWTGIEYEIASLLLYEGMYDLAMKIIRGVRKRYDGERMNPWNEIECGDHYVRAMSSWTLLEAALGYRYFAPSATLEFSPNVPFRLVKGFFITPDGWGTLLKEEDKGVERVEIATKYGSVKVRELRLRVKGVVKDVKVLLNEKTVKSDVVHQDENRIVIRFKNIVNIDRNSTLRIEIFH